MILMPVAHKLKIKNKNKKSIFKSCDVLLLLLLFEKESCEVLDLSSS